MWHKKLTGNSQNHLIHGCIVYWSLRFSPFALAFLCSIFSIIFLLSSSAHSHLWSEFLPWGSNTAGTGSFTQALCLSTTSHTPLFTYYFPASSSHSREQLHLSTWWNLNIWSDFFSTTADHYEQFRIWVGEKRILSYEEFNLFSNLQTRTQSQNWKRW